MSNKNICFIIENENEDEQKNYSSDESYYSRNKDAFKERYVNNIESKRAYQSEYNFINNEKYTEYQKNYYQQRREKLLESKKEKIVCECGKRVSIGYLTCHKKTNMHIKNMLSINKVINI
jgi:hypothetical protein